MKSIWAACRTASCLAVLISLCGCGVSEAGTWENDPGNWERAFQSTQPGDVVVAHSWYWRSSHWTDEFEYFFEIEPNDKLKERLFARNDLLKLEAEDAAAAKDDSFNAQPAWFAPKAGEAYEVWVYADRPESHFRIFIDKETGAFFLTNYLF